MSAPPATELVLRPPPDLLPDEETGGVLGSALPMLGSIGSIVLFASVSGSGPGGLERGLLAAGMILAATGVVWAAQGERQRRRRSRRLAASRAEYLRHLSAVRATVREAADRQRRSLGVLHPPPESLPLLVGDGRRVWTRTPDRPGFLQVRYGVGSASLSLRLVVPDAAVERADPVCAAALRRLVDTHAEQQGLPRWLDLGAGDGVVVSGTVERVRAVARAVLCSAVTTHSPAHLTVAVLTREPATWEWVKWLPHALDEHRSDDAGPCRLVTGSHADLADRLRRCGHHVLLVADHDLEPPADLAPDSVTVLALVARDGEEVGLSLADGSPLAGVADLCDHATAEAVARRLAPRIPAGWGTSLRGRVEGVDLVTLLGLDPAGSLDPPRTWTTRSGGDRLRVPIGRTQDGGVVLLDLKEAAQEGMGPHGVILGATGSGKSELLRTVVLALALTHAPEQLHLVLVDYKGGATFAGLARLPHLSALVTNLAEDLALVDRMRDALAGEVLRRQRVLRDSGFASVRDHERARAAGADLPPLPSLLIVVDEFSELLAAQPDLLDLLVTIGRLGRSLGLHLLLASQRLDEGRLHGLESHLSYRIALRTFSTSESRALLGVPDAAGLPRVPGLGYLQPDPATLVRFQAAYVSGPFVGCVDPVDAARTIRPWTVAPVPGEAAARPDDRGPSFLDVAVRALAGSGPRAHRIWLPPLAEAETLGALMADLAPDPDLGLVSREWRTRGGLMVPLGTVDRPREQRRDPMTVDLGGAAGHVAVVGGPRSGTSTFLRTLVASLALVTTPTESQFYVVDLDGGLAGLAGLPHTAAYSTRAQTDVVRRIVAEVGTIAERREAFFAEQAIDSVAAYRSLRAQGRCDDGWGEVFLVVDGWAAVGGTEFDDLEPALRRLAVRGLSVGIHLLTCSSRWTDYRAGVRDRFGTRIELRLGDPTDSEVSRRAASLVPRDRPGRGLLPDGLQVLVALPRLDGSADPATAGPGLADLVRRMATSWRGPTGPKLRLLPAKLTCDELVDRRAADDGTRLLIGVREPDLSVAALEPAAEPHWLVLGEAGSGCTAALRTYLHEVVRTRTPQQAQVVVVDPRRTLCGEVPRSHLLDHLTSADRALPALTELASSLSRRAAAPDAAVEQADGRPSRHGPDVWVVVDDLDLLAERHGSPLDPLLPLLARGRDVGLHLAVARRSGGASRALYEPVLQTLRELATPGLLLSGSPDEGPLVGGLRAVLAPPGRGRLVTRRGVEVVQVAWVDPAR